MRKSLCALILLGFTIDSFAEHKILIVGDSHLAGSFGDELDKSFRETNGITTESYASCGSSASSWYNNWVSPCGYVSRSIKGERTYKSSAPTPKISELLEKVKPTLTVVELGTNDLTVTNFTQKLENIKKMIIDINESGSECAWIGAPDVRFATQEVQNQYNSKLEELVNQNDCFFINSKSITQYPKTGGDGIHYTGFSEETKKWAASVSKNIKDFLNEPKAEN